VPQHDDELIEDLLSRSRDREQRFNVWLDQLRAGDPAFAEASLFYPADMGEWHAAVYLLTGCDQVWLALAQHVLSDVSIAPVINELEDNRRAWSSSEDAVMRWAAPFWDVDRWPAKFPHVFEAYYFRRWVTPATSTGGSRRLSPTSQGANDDAHAPRRRHPRVLPSAGD
jgi:hypothetical protein